MKNFFLILSLFVFVNTYSQKQDTLRRNAISGGIKVALIYSAEVAYDRIISQYINWETYAGYSSDFLFDYDRYNKTSLGSKIDFYINKVNFDKMRFYFTGGVQGSLVENYIYNASNSIYYDTYSIGKGFEIAPFGGVGLSYFGKNGFHFKLENSLLYGYNKVDYIGYSRRQGTIIYNLQREGIILSFKPNVRIGYRF